MTHNLASFARRAKRWATALRNAPLTILGSAIVVALEGYSAGYIFQTTTADVSILGVSVHLALIEASASLGCGLLAFWGSLRVAAFKSDPRPSQQKRAFGARVLSLALIVVPVSYLGNGFAYQHQLAMAREYRASDEYRADLRAVELAQTQREMDEVAANLERAADPETARFDFFFWMWGAFLHGCVMLAGGMFWQAKAETPAEAARREREARVEKARLTRDRNQKAKERETRPPFTIFSGGRKAA